MSDANTMNNINNIKNMKDRMDMSYANFSSRAMIRNGKYLVEVDPDAVDDLIVFNLKTHLAILKNAMKSRKSPSAIGFWSSDPDEDVKEYKRMIKAFEKVLWYYSGEETEDYPKKD